MSDAVLTTAIVTSGTVIVAVITTFGGRAIVKRSKARRKSDVAAEEREAVEAFANDPGQWVKDVLASNRDYAEEVRGLRREVADLRAENARRDERERTFLAAIARWVVDIARAWGIAEDMPYPREEDREVLAEVIPVMVEATRPRRKHRTNGQTT